LAEADAVVFFFRVPRAAGTTAGTTAFFTFFFFFIGTRGEKGSLEVLAMGDWRSSCHGGLEGQRQRGWQVILGWIMEVHVYSMVFSTLCRVSRKRFASTHLFEGVNQKGDVL
jgi:hypothetical protein